MKMGDNVEGDGFWLPSEFFTDEDFLVERENLMKNSSKSAINETEYCFPSEFPYILPSNGMSTRNDAVEGLIYRAADQVAKIKLSGGGADGFVGFGPRNGPIVGHQLGFSPQQQQQRVYRQQHSQSCGEMGQAAWPIQANRNRVFGSVTRSNLIGGSGGSGAVKRESAGTGVFIPRTYNDASALYPSDSRKKPACSTSFVPNRPVFSHSKPTVHKPQLNRVFIQQYEALVARRHALIMQQRRNLLLAEGSSIMSLDSYLPQEWTY